MATLTEIFTNIANAIRAKLGVATTYTPAQMPNAIASIPLQKPEQGKSTTATTTQQTILPDSGYALAYVFVNPQSHSETYTPSTDTAANDMGANHNKRYVNTSNMYLNEGNALSRTGNGSFSTIYSSNGKKCFFSKVNIAVPQGCTDFGLQVDIYKNVKLSANATATISVSKKPKYLTCSVIGSIDTQFMLLYDVEKGKAWRTGYWSSTNYNEDYSSSISSYFPSISASSITIKNPNSSQRRVMVTGYY